MGGGGGGEVLKEDVNEKEVEEERFNLENCLTQVFKNTKPNQTKLI